MYTCHDFFRGSWQTPDSCRCYFSRCIGRKRPWDVSNSTTCTNLRCLGPFVKLSSVYFQSWRLHSPSGHLLRVWPTSWYSVVSLHLARTTMSQLGSAAAGSNSLLSYCRVPLRRVWLCLLHALQLGSCRWQSVSPSCSHLKADQPSSLYTLYSGSPPLWWLSSGRVCSSIPVSRSSGDPRTRQNIWMWFHNSQVEGRDQLPCPAGCTHANNAQYAVVLAARACGWIMWTH